MQKNILLFVAGFLILLTSPSLCNAQGTPVRLELKPFPKPEDGIVRCKPDEELQIQLVGYDADKQETSLNQFKPTATSSNRRVATALVPDNTGHTVILRCISEGSTIITASYGKASTNLNVEVGVVKQTAEITAQPSPSPTPQPSPQTTGQGMAGYEIVQNSVSITDNEPFHQVSVLCPAGKGVLGGGTSLDPWGNGVPFSYTWSEPFIKTLGVYGWHVGVNRIAGYIPSGKTYTFKVHAICAKVQ